jgi:tetratricopeptide (TPR) repeat protein
MLLRLSGAVSRGALVLLAFLAAIVLAYFSIHNALAAHVRRLDSRAGYERAVQLEPGNARNWYLLGRYWQYNMENPDPRRAIAYYQKSLSLNPLSADAWLDLATDYDGEGDTAEARSAFLSAYRVYPASADVAWRYGNFLLRQGELSAAFEQIHRALLQDPKRGAEAFSRCWRADPDAEAILDRVIPPNRDIYLAIIQDQASSRQLDPALAVWRRLVALHPSISPQEIAFLANALLQTGRTSELVSVWHQATSFMPIPPPPDPPGSLIWDGGFESGVNGFGLAWQIPKDRSGVRTDLDGSEKHGGSQSLRLSFSGNSNSSYADACHFVIPQPGVTYRLSGWVRTRAFTSNEGIRLRLLSFEKAGTKFVETSEVHGTEPWTNLSLLWTAPLDLKSAEACIARRASDDPDGEIQGTAWVDDVSLIPVSSGTTKP